MGDGVVGDTLDGVIVPGSKQLQMITRQTTNAAAAPAAGRNDGPTDSLSAPPREPCCQRPGKSTGVDAPLLGCLSATIFLSTRYPPPRPATSSKINALNGSGVSAGKRMTGSPSPGALEAPCEWPFLLCSVQAWKYIH